MSGKVREDDHKPREPGDSKAVSRVCLDYCFLGRVVSGEKEMKGLEDVKGLSKAPDEREGTVPVLTVVDERTGCVFAAAVAKAANPYAIHIVVEALTFLGRQRVILYTDPERSTLALAEAAAAAFQGEAQIMSAPRESHASNGIVESGNPRAQQAG